MKLATAMLSGGHRESVNCGAIRSAAGFTDCFILIRTGESADRAIEVALELCAELGIQCIVSQFPGEYRACCDGRNFCLSEAHRLGFDWCCVLDTDERMHYSGTDVREALSKLDVDIVLTKDTTGAYPKARFIRMPAVGGYKDRVHEIYEGASSVTQLDSVTFSELLKSDAEQDARMRTIIAECEAWALDEPAYSRPELHWGNSLCYFNEQKDAIPHFIRCAELTQYSEERAWALIRAAQCFHEIGDNATCIRLCGEALVACPYWPEAPFLAAFACATEDRHFDALGWARIAIALGNTSPIPNVTPLRAGHRYPLAYHDGPWDIRAATLEALGLDELAKVSRDMQAKAEAARTGGQHK